MPAVAILAGGAAVDGRAADLQRYPILPAPPEARIVPAPPVVGTYVYPPDPGPASTVGGYYGYYGTDIQGVPYYGLYSEDVTCLRSAVTPRGYRVVDICRER